MGTPVGTLNAEAAGHATEISAWRGMLTIARFGTGGRSADYYLDRGARCEEEPDRHPVRGRCRLLHRRLGSGTVAGRRR